MTRSVSPHLRSLFSLEREIEMEEILPIKRNRSPKLPQPTPPQLDLTDRDSLCLSATNSEEHLNLLKFPEIKNRHSAAN